MGGSVISYDKDESIQNLGDPFHFCGIVLEGTVEGSFLSENYNKINMNLFSSGRSYGEALSVVGSPHSPIQLTAKTNCTILRLDLSHVLTPAPGDCDHELILAKNLIRILASQNVFSNLKLRIANQRSLRDRILMYLSSLVPDKDGNVSVPFTQTALAEFLGVNRSALSRELGRMQDEGILHIDGKIFKLSREATGDMESI